MGEVDVTLAESDREIKPADVAKLKRSTDPQRKQKGALLQAVLDYREEYDVGPQPRGPKGRFQTYDTESETEAVDAETDGEGDGG